MSDEEMRETALAELERLAPNTADYGEIMPQHFILNTGNGIWEHCVGNPTDSYSVVFTINERLKPGHPQWVLVHRLLGLDKPPNHLVQGTLRPSDCLKPEWRALDTLFHRLYPAGENTKVEYSVWESNPGEWRASFVNTSEFPNYIEAMKTKDGSHHFPSCFIAKQACEIHWGENHQNFPNT